MTNKGMERRGTLIAAGLELLTAKGWCGVTHRGVASRAKANPGLVHYYFEGSAGLRRAVAERAAQVSLTEVTDQLLRAKDEAELLTGIHRMLDSVGADPARARLTAELVTAAHTDAEIREVVTSALSAARARIAQWLTARRPELPAAQAGGCAALLLAAVDGAVLHRLLDPDLPAAAIVAAMRTPAGGADR